MTYRGAGRGSQWSHHCDFDRFVVSRTGKSMVPAEMGGLNVPCRGRKEDSLQAAAPAMYGEILRVSVWHMCRNPVQQGSGFEWRLLVPCWLGRASPLTSGKVSRKDA